MTLQMENIRLLFRVIYLNSLFSFIIYMLPLFHINHKIGFTTMKALGHKYPYPKLHNLALHIINNDIHSIKKTENLKIPRSNKNKTFSTKHSLTKTFFYKYRYDLCLVNENMFPFIEAAILQLLFSNFFCFVIDCIFVIPRG